MKLYSMTILLLATNTGLLPESCAEKLNIKTTTDNTDTLACIAQAWSKTVSLTSDAAQNVQVLVFPSLDNTLYAALPVNTNNANPAYGRYNVTLYKDCTVSFTSKGNGKLVTAWEDDAKKNSTLAANGNKVDRYSRFEVVDNYDNTYKFRSVGLGSTLMVDSRQQLRTTRPEVTLSNDPAYFQAMKFRVVAENH